MKRIAGILFSSRLMAILLALFAISIAVATFIENDFGSTSARAVVYNARWFELLLLLGIVNLTGNIVIRKLYVRSKLTIFLFHLAFLLILIGAAVTRYTGFEGTLAIREGEQSGAVLTENAYIGVVSGEGETARRAEFPVNFSALGRNKFNVRFNLNGQTVRLTCKSFIPNAVPGIEATSGGKPVAEIVYSDREGRKSLIIGSGEIKAVGSVLFCFDAASTDSNAVILSSSGDSLSFTAPFPVALTSMADQSSTILDKNTVHPIYARQLYTFNNMMLVISKYFSEGKVVAQPLASQEGQTYDAVVIEATAGKTTSEFTLWGKAGTKGIPEPVDLDGIMFTIDYGSAYRELPFKLKLNNFIIERYPGSQSPSSFESHVTLSDPQHNISESKRIYMNNILKYRGYRFYQSSYDPDEKGTILSVNHDWAGTLLTYAGYLLMALGMALSLFNGTSRFRALSKEISQLKIARKAISVVLWLFLVQGFIMAQESRFTPSTIPVDAKHANRFGKILVQDNGGRIEPVNTLTSEILRKLSRKSTYKGMSPNQVFLGMMADPASWQYEPMIRATHPQIQEILGSSEKYYSFASFFKDNNYILGDYVEKAFRKTPAFRSKFDNEVIRLDERINIAYLVYTGEMLRVLPVPGDSTQTWYSHQGIKGRITTSDSMFVQNIIPLYLQDVQQSLKTGNWGGPDSILLAISNYQAQQSGDILPPPQKVSLEIFMNQTDIFARISNVYGLIGFVLLLLQFASIFLPGLKLKVPVMISTVLIILLFAFHTTGLGIRWYVAGHAPWSNGYEALTYVAWATVLAGLIFASRSSITLSATAILSFLILHTAHLSWMDPQITNLVPVLRSYWLVIHVATITASYGFLALGSLLAFINLVLMILQTPGKKELIRITIQELTCIIEMALIVGLYLLTIGTFLGGVWANESWGRYWGWDPKETWALVTVLIYAFIVHMRMVPGLRGYFAFNLASLLGIGSVLMTYFGVNYYLSGLHSYAKGDPLPVPPFVYYSVAVVFIFALIAYWNDRRLNQPDKT
jgi:cytochrome c-type biogenesis protein CcsB